MSDGPPLCPTCETRPAEYDPDDGTFRECAECRSTVGKVAELWVLLEAAETYPASSRDIDRINRLDGFAEIVRFGRDLPGKADVSDLDAVRRVRQWYIDRHAGTENEFLNLKRSALVELLQTETVPGIAAHSADFRSVRWGETKFSFTVMQAACVNVLWENWKRGTPDVADQTVLDAVEGFQARIDHVFNRGKHPAWKTMIVAGKTRGTHRLADPENR